MTLANDCNPGVANGLLGSFDSLVGSKCKGKRTNRKAGLTVQQAQELGLHIKRPAGVGEGLYRDGIHPLWSVPATHPTLPALISIQAGDCISR